MKILYILSIYNVGDGVSNALYSQIENKNNWDDYWVICKWKYLVQDHFHIVEFNKVISRKLCETPFDCIHYFKGTPSNILELVINVFQRRNIKIPVLTTVCQNISFKSLLLSPYEIKVTDHFVFIDKTSYNSPIISFIPKEIKTQIYLSSPEVLKQKTENVLFKQNSNGVIIYGRGSTLSKCPKNMFEVFDSIDIPNKLFYIIGIPFTDNWVRKEARKRENVIVYPQLPYNEWFDICTDFDVCLYQIPKNSHASIDANLGLPMLMRKPVVYYGPEAPKERFEHGKNGFVATNVEEISYYATLLGKNEEMRRNIGECARKSSLLMFSYQKRIDSYNEIYLNISKKVISVNIPFKYYITYVRYNFRRMIRSFFNYYTRPKL